MISLIIAFITCRTCPDPVIVGGICSGRGRKGDGRGNAGKTSPN